MKYVISDIHGCCRTLKALVFDKIKLSKRDHLYLLGDYIDRGPDSKGVLDFIQHLIEEGYPLYVLRGNHDQLLLDSCSKNSNNQVWVSNGGEKTLESFGVNEPFEIPASYFHMIREMDYYLELNDVFLVHAGFNFSSEHVFKDVQAMMNIRNMSIDNALICNKKIIHGHTPTPLSQIQRSVNSSFQEICIDNGCVFKDLSDYGNLIALELDNMKIHIQSNIE